MVPDITDIDEMVREALAEFWSRREDAKAKGKDKTGRGEAAAGKHLDPLIAVIKYVIQKSGLSDANFYFNRKANLPGYFRPTKQWDLVVVHRGKLAIVLELKSQVGSYGNNFNNRVEEALGSAVDLQSAITEGALQEFVPEEGFLSPFRGWLMVLAEEERSTGPTGKAQALFPVDEEFLYNGNLVSYSMRYSKFASRLVQSRYYNAAAIILTKRNSSEYKYYGLSSFWKELTFFSAKLAST